MRVLLTANVDWYFNVVCYTSLRLHLVCIV